MMIDNVGEVFYIGSQQGTAFLSSFPDVGVQFRRYFSMFNLLFVHFIFYYWHRLSPFIMFLNAIFSTITERFKTFLGISHLLDSFD